MSGPLPVVQVETITPTKQDLLESTRLHPSIEDVSDTASFRRDVKPLVPGPVSISLWLVQIPRQYYNLLVLCHT